MITKIFIKLILFGFKNYVKLKYRHIPLFLNRVYFSKIFISSSSTDDHYSERRFGGHRKYAHLKGIPALVHEKRQEVSKVRQDWTVWPKSNEIVAWRRARSRQNRKSAYVLPS